MSFLSVLGGGGGDVRKMVTTLANESLSEIILKVTNECRNDLAIVQGLTIDCNPSNPFAASSVSWENSQQCAQCYQDIVEAQESRYDLIRTYWDKHGGSSIDLSFDDDMNEVLSGMLRCTTKCKACIFSDISQVSYSQWKATCDVSTTIVNSITDNFSADFMSKLSSNTGILNAMAGILGTGDAADIQLHIDNRIKTLVSQSYVRELINIMRAKQNIYLTGQSTYATGLSQIQNVTGMSDLVSKTRITNDLFTQQQWTSMQNLVNENMTIGKYARFVTDASVILGEVTSTVTGQVLEISWIILMAVSFVLAVVAAIALAKASGAL